MLVSRKLATIVFADIAGYSALMQADEVKALAILDRFRAVLESGIGEQGGKIIQYYGDGCLLSYDSALHCLRACVSMQRQFIKQEVPVRIGMHLGDVLYKNDNAFGDGVNIASRIESLGVPGAILFSKTVKNQIKNQPEFLFTSVGSYHFKNISEPMEVFALSNPEFSVPLPEEMQGKLQNNTSPPPNPSEKSDWEKYQLLEILDALETNQCVLILGPYAFSKPTGSGEDPEKEIFLPELLMRDQHKWMEDLPLEGAIDFFTSAQALSNRPGGQRMFRELTRINLKDLGEKQLNRFRKISEIPFDLILSTYPFDLIQEVFDHHQMPYQFAYYNYLQDTPAIQDFSAAQPLIYNLFGSERHKESMVTSLDRLYQFIFGILGVHRFPKIIEDKVQQASHLVFLGSSFEEWYMKILLRVLKVHEKEISYAHPPGPASLGRENRMFFESNFKITFLDKEIDEFVNNLHKICAEEKVLRQPKESSNQSSYDYLHLLNEQFRFQEVFGILDEWLLKDGKEVGLLKELTDYQKKYHFNHQLDHYDILSKTDLDKEWQILRKNLSVFINRVAESIPA